MKILITGGHFSPAYAVIQELQKRDHEVIIVGRVHPLEGDRSGQSLEYRISKELSLPFIELKTGRLQRRVSLYAIPSLLRFGKAIVQSISLLKKTKPDVVLTFGGYIALPVAIAAKMVNIPVVTHEQTQGLGLSNTIIARFSDALCLSFPESLEQNNSGESVLTGNPMRKELFEIDKKLDIESTKPVIYITGGSTGSHVINRTVGEALPTLLEQYSVVHQTGENEFHDYEALEKRKQELSPELQKRYLVRKYIFPSEIGYVYSQSALLVGRSGANTVLELIATNTPALLIPLPHGQKGEQQKNAELIAKLGLGEILPQKSLNAESLVAQIDAMHQKLAQYTVSQDIINRYIFPNAAGTIVDVVTAQYEKKKNHS